MSPPTRQDIQNILHIELTRTMERVATKQEIILLSDTIRNLVTLHQQSQQLFKQSEYQRVLLTKRAIALEARLSNLENEIRVMHAIVAKLPNQQKPMQVIMPVQPPVEAQEQATPITQYALRPS